MATGLELAAAGAGFLGLAALLFRASKSVADFTSIIKSYPDELKDVELDLRLVRAIIDSVDKQYNLLRDVDSVESDALREAISKAEACHIELSDLLHIFLAKGGSNKILNRVRFALTANERERLRSKMGQFKILMLDVSKVIESEIHQDTNKVVHESQDALEEINHKTGKICEGQDRAEQMMEDLRQSLAQVHLLMSASGSPTAVTPPLRPCDVETGNRLRQAPTAGHVNAASTSLSVSVSEESALSRFPLYQFKDNSFHFLAALIFSWLCNEKNERGPLQKAAGCLRKYPTPESMSTASEEDLKPYFCDSKIKLSEHKKKRIQALIGLASSWQRKPPRPGFYYDNNSSEISHLVSVGQTAVDTWTAYCRDSFYRGSGKAIKSGWREVKENGREKSQRLSNFIEYCASEEAQRQRNSSN